MTLPAPALPLAMKLHTLLNTALASLLSNLGDTVGGPVGRAVIAPGAVVPADGCCDTGGGTSGQAWARLARLYPSTRFPQPDPGWSPAPKRYAVEIELGVYRCVAGLDDDGAPPLADEVTADAIRALDDVAALRATALGTFGRAQVVEGAASSLGPAGYCAGSSLTFTVAFNPACEPGVTP